MLALLLDRFGVEYRIATGKQTLTRLGDSIVPDLAYTLDMALEAVIINDADLVLDGLEPMLNSYRDRVVVTGVQVAPLQPMPGDVAIVDMYSDYEDGSERLRQAVALSCFEHVVLYAWHMSAEQLEDAIADGASGILAKSTEAPTLVDDLERIVHGERVVHEFLRSVDTEFWRSDSEPPLTERDCELLRLVAHGMSNLDIAATMFLAESTVKTYLKRLYRKLGINSRAQCVMRAVELGETALPEHPDSAAYAAS